MIPYGKQSIDTQEINAVSEVLKSDWLTQGPTVPTFERTISEYCNANHAIAVSNATSALHIACLALSLGPNDILWTSPISFVASANCGLYCGAKVDFVDIDPISRNISIQKLQEKLRLAKQNNSLPKILVAVHFAGRPCDMHAIGELSTRYNFSVIEDACHAIGGTYGKQAIGSCEYSDITVFSFHPVKTMTTAEGGVATCRSEEIKNRLERLRSHGIDKQSVRHNEPWNYEQNELGYNYRMSEVHAAIGVCQMKKLPGFVDRRQYLFDRYQKRLAELDVKLPVEGESSFSAWHLFVIELANSETRLHCYQFLREHSIYTQVHYIPIHLQPYYQRLGFKLGDFPVAESYYQKALSLPLHPELSDDDQDTVIEVLAQALS